MPVAQRKGVMSYETALTAILGVTFGFVFFDRNALNYLMPFILPEMKLSNAQIGILGAGLSLTWALSGYVIGNLSDRLAQRKRLLLIAVVVFSLSSFVSGLATSFLMLLGARILMGIADGPVLPISQSLMAAESSPERRGLNMGLMQNVMSNLMGSLVAPLVVVALATAFNWRVAFFVTGIPGLVIAFLIWRYVREPLLARAVEGEKKAPKPTIAVIREVLGHRNVWLCLIISGLMVGWMILGWIFLPVYFTQMAGISPTQMSVIMSVLGVTGALAGFIVPGLSDRFGRRPVMIVFCAIGILSPLAALFLSDAFVPLALILGTGWVAGGTFSIFMATIPSESVAEAHIATTMGLIMGTGELIGGFAAPLIVGWASDIYGLTTPLVAEIALAGSAAVLSLFLIETAPVKKIADTAERQKLAA